MSRLEQLEYNKIPYNIAETLFEKTDMGLDIFKKELNDFALNKNIRNPFKAENNPSARLKKSSTSDLWLLNIYNEDGGCFNAIQFIQKKYTLSYQQAIDFIQQNKIADNSSVQGSIPIIKSIPIYYDVKVQPFTHQHTDYFCIHGVTEKFINKEMDIYAVKKYAKNKYVQEPEAPKYMFCYKFRDISGNIVNGKMKFLTLGTDKAYKWINNISPIDFFYTYKISKKDKYVFVVKSNKDAIVFQQCGLTAIATMSENKWNIIEGLKKLQLLFPKIIFVSVMGSDEQGFNTSVAITKELNLPWFNTPKRFLKNGINDPWEYFKNFGLNSFKQLLKNKNYL